MDIYICTENRGQRIPTLCNLGGISYRCSVVKMLSVFFFFFFRFCFLNPGCFLNPVGEL